MALRLAADGLAAAVNSRRDTAGLDQVVAEIRATGGTAEACPADVTDEAGVRDLVARVADRLGPVDVLVVNATGPQPSIPLADLTWEDQLDQLRFFVKSPTLLVQAVLPGMRERGGGRIIQIGSDIVDRNLPGMSAYIAAKGAQHAMTEAWARELGPYGITVNVVAPGWIPVERHAGLDPDAYVAEVPLRRMGTPADVAAAVSFLASDGARSSPGSASRSTAATAEPGGRIPVWGLGQDSLEFSRRPARAGRMRKWLSGRASPCQGEGRGFESRLPLGASGSVAWPRGEAAACKAVHTGSNPVATSQGRLAQRESASLTRKRSLVQSQYRPP